ncbi:hypothetical protein AX17_000639 [Amanita inopinata Kibby_2008]|nr:hypothetical protein AX17_000639 [Amanita inopinata Kibby_2008]
MSDNSGDYGDDEFPQFTEEDFARIDAVASAYYDTPSSSQANPHVTIELENIQHSEDESCVQDRSPFQLYRRNQILSVTDLVSPTWCEVQFDYGLRQRRSRPLQKRPGSFMSASGKEIFVEKEVAAKNDVHTKRGKTIHEKLEREVHKEKVEVDVSSDEERWGIRLLNLIDGVKTMLLTGFTRELPVFGIIKDHIVVGVIDEAICRHYPRSIRTSDDPHAFNAHATQATSSSRQAHINEYFASPNRKEPSQKHTNMLYIIDTKTRRTDSLPPPDDTLPSRLQLMLYYRLLSALLSEYPSFDFPAIWKKLGLDSARLFSANFLIQASLVTNSKQGRTACLDDLVRVWHQVVESMDIVGIDPELQLVYRLQLEEGKIGRQKRRRVQALGNVPTILISQEERELALAIEASLQDLEDLERGKKQEEVLEPLIYQQDDTRDTHSPVDEDLGLSLVGENAGVAVDLTELQACVVEGKGSPDGREHEEEYQSSRIIGTKEFFYDKDTLDVHVASVLEWWHGERRPEGVPLHLSRRCFTCEYCIGCEWREEKAKEAMVQSSFRGKATMCPSAHPCCNETFFHVLHSFTILLTLFFTSLRAMDQWKPYLHWSLEDEHVLLSVLHLNSLSNYFLSGILTITICLIERFLSASLDRHWAPRSVKRSRWRYVAWRTAFYWIAAFMRLCYMLIAMTFNMGLILTIVTSLTLAQFILTESHGSPHFADARLYTCIPTSHQALLESNGQSLNTRTRPRPRPDAIHIHPSESNVARADAFALELGLQSRESVQNDHKEGEGWEIGRGREAAMTLLGPPTRRHSLHANGDFSYLSE